MMVVCTCSSYVDHEVAVVMSIICYRQQVISQYEELLKDCQLDVDTDYPVAISKVFNLSTGHVLLMM